MTDTRGETAASVLFVLWDGGGNVVPTLAVANRLVRRGYRVRVLGSSGLAGRVVAAGCEFRPLEKGDANPKPGRSFEEDLSLATSLVDRGSASDLLNELGRERADLVVVDCMFLGALCGAEASGARFACLSHLLCHFVLEEASSAWRQAVPLLNVVRADLGLDPVLDPVGLFDELWGCADLTVVLSLPELDLPLTDARPWLTYGGSPLPDYQHWDWDLPWPPDAAQPFVVVSMSTTVMHHEAVAQRAVDALSELEVHGLVTLGSGLEPDDVAVPANVVVRRWVPHHAVLPFASALVTHGGHSSIMAGAAHGLPMVCVPLGRDQAFNSSRVAEVGAGCVVSLDAPASIIAASIDDVLESPRYRASASNLQASARRFGFGETAVDILETLART